MHHEWLSCLAGTEPIDDVHWIIPGKGQFPLQLAGYLQYLVVAPPGSAGIGNADMLVNITDPDLHKHILSGVFLPSLGKTTATECRATGQRHTRAGLLPQYGRMPGRPAGSVSRVNL